MKKYIEIIFKDQKSKSKHNVKVTKVARGYALNYLIPNQLAEIATKSKIKHLKILHDISNQKKDQIDQQNEQTIKNIIKMKLIHLRKKCSLNGQIFGSLSEQEIQENIQNTIGKKIEKKYIIIDTIKQIGTYKCDIVINENTKTTLIIRIIPYQI